MKVKKIAKDKEMGELYLAEDFDWKQVKIVMSQGKTITFEKYPQSAVKLLEVNIFTTESEDIALLHKLHTQIRNS